MGLPELRTLATGGCFFEAPRWHGGRWYVSDFYRHLVVSIDADGRERRVLTIDDQPSGLGWLPDGSMIVASMKNRRLLRRFPDGQVRLHADLADVCAGYLNDLVVDAAGRTYVGSYGGDLSRGSVPPAPIVCVQPGGEVSVAATGLCFPNGSVITPGGRTLIVGETLASRYTAFTIAPDGTLADRRVWASLGRPARPAPIGEMMAQLSFAPDGCTLDSGGQLWVADPRGRRCCRVAMGGEITAEIAMPGHLTAVACALGGHDGRTLLICAAPDLLEHHRRDRDEAVLFITRVAAAHAGRP